MVKKKNLELSRGNSFAIAWDRSAAAISLKNSANDTSCTVGMSYTYLKKVRDLINESIMEHEYELQKDRPKGKKKMGESPS